MKSVVTRHTGKHGRSGWSKPFGRRENWATFVTSAKEVSFYHLCVCLFVTVHKNHWGDLLELGLGPTDLDQ